MPRVCFITLKSVVLTEEMKESHVSSLRTDDNVNIIQVTIRTVIIRPTDPVSRQLNARN
jgi:hypothetical protein